MNNVSEIKNKEGLITIIDKSGLDVKRIKFLKEQFKPFIDKTNEWSEKVFKLNVTSPEQKDLMKQAREGRLILKKVRTEADEIIRKTLKEDSLKESKAIQDIYNSIKSLITPMEDHLLEQELYIQLKEKERIDKLNKVRISELEPYSEFVPFGLELGKLPEEEYLKVLNGAKLQLDAKNIQIKKDEDERIKLEDIEKLRSERALSLQPYFDYFVDNENQMNFGKMSEVDFNNLKSNLELRKKDYLTEVKNKEEENKKLLAEKTKREAKAKREKELADAKIKAEKEKNLKLQSELKAKEKKESDEKKAKELAEKQKALAPDKDKLELLAKTIDLMEFPNLDNAEAKTIEEKR